MKFVSASQTSYNAPKAVKKSRRVQVDTRPSVKGHGLNGPRGLNPSRNEPVPRRAPTCHLCGKVG